MKINLWLYIFFSLLNKRYIFSAQTVRLLAEMTLMVNDEFRAKGVKTTLYYKAKRKLQDPAAANMLILRGSGYGCNYVAKMIFTEKCQNMTGYLLLNIDEWYAVDLSKRTVILIPDADLAVWSNRLLHDIIYAAKSGGDLAVIITTENVEDDRLMRYSLDSSAVENLPTAKEKEEYLEYKAKAERVRICSFFPNGIIETNDEDGRMFIEMSEEIKHRILDLVGDKRWIKRINSFFESHLLEGTSYFYKPIADIQDSFTDIHQKKKIFSYFFSVCFCFHH